MNFIIKIFKFKVQLTQQQLAMLRQQMGGTPMIVQAPQTIFQTQSGQNIAIPMNIGQQGIFINPQTGQLQQQQPQQMQQQVQQQQQQQQKDEPH